MRSISTTAGGSVLPPSGTSPPAPRGAATDFDFLIGRWRVQHRRLSSRLTGSKDWMSFDGECVTRKLLGGRANVDDHAINLPGGPYRAAAIRVFDPSAQAWSIFWIDSRYPPADMEPPVVGGFSGRSGLFYADHQFGARPVRTRFIWHVASLDLCHWEQAYSIDGGQSWETNWHMRFKRAG